MTWFLVGGVENTNTEPVTTQTRTKAAEQMAAYLAQIRGDGWAVINHYPASSLTDIAQAVCDELNADAAVLACQRADARRDEMGEGDEL